MPTKGPLIYLLTFPSGRKYVGQTIRTFEERMKSHKNSAKAIRGCRLVKAAVKKYGWASVKTEILVLCDLSQVDVYEIKFIQLYNTMAPNGYNLETGGHANKIISESSRKLMSESQKRRDNKPFRKSEETKELPKFIGKVNRQYSVGYKISRHPKCRYKNFCDKTKTDEENLQAAKDFLKKLDANEIEVIPRPKKTLPIGLHVASGGYRVELRDRILGRYSKMFNTGNYTDDEQFNRALSHLKLVNISRLRPVINKVKNVLEEQLRVIQKNLETLDKMTDQINKLRTMFND